MNTSIAVVGAGIIGAAVAREVTRRFPDAEVTVYEKETQPAAHQTGHNSGVVHAGLYYEPGGLKATLCRRGAVLLRDYCRANALPYQECGKLVVALEAHEEHRLAAIYERARANGVPDVEMVGPDGIRSIEPNATGRVALHSPHTAIVDYARVARAFLQDVTDAGGTVRLGTEVLAVLQDGPGSLVETPDGRARHDVVISCAGLQADRLARRSGGEALPHIVPFFGQYLRLEPAYRDVLNGLVYPVPDPRYPFLGVHLTKRVDGEMLVGPNAFLALAREGYRMTSVDLADAAEIARSAAFWRFARKNVAGAGKEIRTIVSSKRFIAEAARYVPCVAGARATRIPRGVRAQAMDARGELLDDFAITHLSGRTDVRNAPSPGATSSMAIAEHIVGAAASAHGLRGSHAP